ncbi:THUMP domain-containing protein 2 [Clonorchis sinensis]|uniref:THUMP domain-containing protein 2 n=1 Tax=Clonorchis sinensis TaxID=79923 RepID=G7Y7J2_CLOSI|nr:THUMP domain-containing protein 2 [Clonorchis sinensis]
MYSVCQEQGCRTEPISKRIYTLHRGLRPTSATAIVMHIQDGIVLDPMCGKGILLCEAASSCKKRMLSERESTKQSPFYLIGSDCSLNQLTHARDNLSNMQSSLIWDLVLCTIERTPFRAGVCDSVACDLPFGYKYGAYTRGSEEFNHMAVQRCHRNCAELLRSTLRSGGEFRLLVATRLSNWFMGLLSNMDLTVIHTYPISMGATKAVIISGRKNPG